MSTDQESPPAQTENPPETDDAKALNDPNVKKPPPAPNETPPETDNSKAYDPNVDETPPETDNSKALKDPKVDETPPPQTQIPPVNQSIAEVVEPLSKQASAADADPHVQQVTPLENELTTSKNSPSSSSQLNYAPGQITATHEPETDENTNSRRNEFPNNNANPYGVHEISPAADHETTSKQLSLPKNNSSANDDPKTSSSKTIKRVSSTRSEKRSLWDLVRHFFKNSRKGSQPQPWIAMSQAKKESESPSKLKQAIEEDIKYIDKGGKMIDQYKEQLNALLKKSEKLDPDMTVELRRLKQDLIKLKLQASLRYKVKADGSLMNLQLGSETKQGNRDKVLDMMPRLHNDDVFKSSPEFKDFEARYYKLEDKLKLCLLCFSVFPENEIVKKRMMVQWWVTEGFASEDCANKIFLKLIEEGFIEPVNDNRSLFVKSCRMQPFYRSALVVLAKRAKFSNFDHEGGPTQDFSGSFQACLVGQGLISYEDLKSGLVKVDDLEKIHLLINVNESILEFKPHWFAKMKNLNFLYLGRWGASETDHREVDDTAFLDELKNLSFVKFLSLQGVSNIIDLPESILKLTNLEILDIRACHNLETIPKRIGLLKNLTHLDMSECYLLEHMPKALSSLETLKVLKGFVIKAPGKRQCTLDDLKKLTKLNKLSIYTDLREFPNEKNIEALGNLTGLRKLTITWAGNAFLKGSEVKNGSSKTCRLPLDLQKLDLRYFPMSATPDWLTLKNMKELKSLKKLYIRGGRFSDIGQYQDSDWDWPIKRDTWAVEILRLRYLPEIEMEWRQVHELFPNLVYLERFRCPKLTLFPCDANGVWMNKKLK